MNRVLSYKIKHTHFFVFLLFICMILSSYFFGGYERLVKYLNNHTYIKLVFPIFIYVFSHIITFVLYSLLDIDSKLNEYSLKEEKNRFIERYNLKIVDVLVTFFVFVCGLISRLLGYNWGIVSSFQPDEGHMAGPALDMAINNSLYQTMEFYYPAQFVSKIQSFFIVLAAKNDGIMLTSDYVNGYFVCRIITAIFGALTILSAFLVGNYLKKHLGTIFAILVAVFPVYNNLAKQVTGDVTVCFFLSLLVLFSLQYKDTKRRRYIVLMTMVAAMATLEKWHGAVGIGYVGFVILISNIRSIKDILTKGLSALCLYFIWIGLFAPNLLFNLKSAIVDGFIGVAVYDGGSKPGFINQFVFYLKAGFLDNAGIVYLALIIFGIICSIKLFKDKMVMFILPLAKFFILCLMNRGFQRWGLEIYFFEILLASVAIWYLLNSSKKYVKIMGSILGSVVCLEMLIGAIVFDSVALHSYNDTRTVQLNDMLERDIAFDQIYSENYTAYKPGNINNWGYDATDSYSEILCIDGDNLFRIKDVNFIANNVERYEEEWDIILDNNCDKILEYDARYSDTFQYSTDLCWNDIKKITHDLAVIEELDDGILIGRDISVYDISDIPLKD